MKRRVVHSGFFIGTLLYFTAALFFSGGVLVYADVVDVSVSVQLFECSDSIDNDFDGLIDFPNDPGCTDAGDDNETDPECLDGIDNDGDLLTDFPADPGCDNPNDDDETDSAVPPTGGSEGGRRVILPTAASRVIFAGLAHPGSRVVLLKDALIAEETIADTNARFSLSLRNIPVGDYVFTLYGVDTDGVRSGLASFTVTIPQSLLVDISGIFIPPTIYLTDRTDEKLVSVSGRTVPNAPVTIAVFSEGAEHSNFSSTADSFGRYRGTFGEPIFRVADTPVKSFAEFESLTSPFSAAAALLSLTSNIVAGDFNFDKRVDLIDFSMLAFWYKRTGAPTKFDLNSDGVVDLVDLSIMVSHWTG